MVWVSKGTRGDLFSYEYQSMMINIVASDSEDLVLKVRVSHRGLNNYLYYFGGFPITNMV